MSESRESAEIVLPESWREQAERRLIIGGVAIVLATAFVLAVQLLR